ncbi:MAG: hypothetical protein RBS80_11835, partial [Thermoguttaceae bacterium]|nr:hypothetical protein [Thermoguttaceae bacterium]
MPVLELMSWSAKRWHKQYRGKHYTVSPRQLGTPATRAASRVAANEWWEQTKDEIDSLPPEVRHPQELIEHYDYSRENHRLFAKWQRTHGQLHLAEKSESHLEWLDSALQSEHPPYPLSKWQEDPLWQERRDPEGDLVWMDRFNYLRREEAGTGNIPTENTIRGHIDSFLKLLEVQQTQGRITLGTYQTCFHRLQVFRKWVSPDNALDNLNESMIQDFFVWLATECTEGRMASETAVAVQRNVRRFVRSRWELRLIDLPRNLNSRNLTIGNSVQAIETLTVAQVKEYLAASSGRLKLFVLLMLNCGMYSSDIGGMTKREVDLRAGTITRKRTKTRNRSEKVPTVTYRLWDETLTLLRTHESSDSVLCLLNEKGGPLWIERRQEEGKYTRNDTVKNLWFRFQAHTLK